MSIDHKVAHNMIQALSMSPEGKELIRGLENIRYYHFDGEVEYLGYGAVMVTSWEEDSDGDYFYHGRILLPGKRDKLFYESAAYQAAPVPGAIYWDLNDNFFVIPRLLGEWAAECIMEHSNSEPVSPKECRGAAYSVNGMDGMVVTAPENEYVPGLTKDKWARKIAFQSHYKCYDLPSLLIPGYMQACDIVYNASAGHIANVVNYIRDRIFESPEKVVDEDNLFEYVPTNVLRAACQILSGYKHWDYFDTCSPLQCARHLFANDFTPSDLSE